MKSKRDKQSQIVTCRNCAGRGRFEAGWIFSPCVACNGRGWVFR